VKPTELTAEERKALSAHKVIVFAKDQPQYIPLPAVVLDGVHGRVITRWTLTEEERQAVLEGADLYLELLTFGQPLQPMRLTVGGPCPMEATTDA
jgi:hypothetical protein